MSARLFQPVVEPRLRAAIKVNSRPTEQNSTPLTIIDSFDLPPGHLVEIEL
jgi:hypothetical protein